MDLVHNTAPLRMEFDSFLRHPQSEPIDLADLSASLSIDNSSGSHDMMRRFVLVLVVVLVLELGRAECWSTGVLRSIGILPCDRRVGAAFWVIIAIFTPGVSGSRINIDLICLYLRLFSPPSSRFDRKSA